jgi:hypothetical protein
MLISKPNSFPKSFNSKPISKLGNMQSAKVLIVFPQPIPNQIVVFFCKAITANIGCASPVLRSYACWPYAQGRYPLQPGLVNKNKCYYLKKTYMAQKKRINTQFIDTLGKITDTLLQNQACLLPLL